MIFKTCPAPRTGSLEGRHTTSNSRITSFARRAILSLALIGLSATAANAQLVIGNSPGLFTPSFRDPLNTDAGNTTYFGWGPATGWGAGTNFRFDGLTDDNLIDNPPALQGVGGLTGTLNQVGPNVILSSSNNIYTAANEETHLTLTVPTNGTAGLDGFTTIILQGRTLFGGFGEEIVFNAIGEVDPDVVFGTNATGAGQFWVKYELPGNVANYTVDIALPSHTSIGEISVDTQWSTTSYAGDTAQAVPEPTSAMLILAGMAPLALRRRRKNVTAAA